MATSTLNTAIIGTSIRCTCCPRRKKLAELHRDSGLEIINGRSGNLHDARVSPRELLEALSGTEGTGVVAWVRGLFDG